MRAIGSQTRGKRRGRGTSARRNAPPRPSPTLPIVPRTRSYSTRSPDCYDSQKLTRSSLELSRRRWTASADSGRRVARPTCSVLRTSCIPARRCQCFLRLQRLSAENLAIAPCVKTTVRRLSFGGDNNIK